jgi:hypothetical protein
MYLPPAVARQIFAASQYESDSFPSWPPTIALELVNYGCSPDALVHQMLHMRFTPCNAFRLQASEMPARTVDQHQPHTFSILPASLSRSTAFGVEFGLVNQSFEIRQLLPDLPKQD